MLAPILIAPVLLSCARLAFTAGIVLEAASTPRHVLRPWLAPTAAAACVVSALVLVACGLGWLPYPVVYIPLALAGVSCLATSLALGSTSLPAHMRPERVYACAALLGAGGAGILLGGGLELLTR